MHPSITRVAHAHLMKQAFDADQERLYDALKLIAENDGQAYKKKDAKGAVTRAWKEWMASTKERHEEDFGRIEKQLVKDLAARWRATHKSAGRNDRNLVKGIEKVLEEIRNIMADDPDLGPGGKYYRDPVADVAIHSGKATERYGGGAVVLTYDGAGYDYFSPNADYHVSDRWRDKLDVIAKRLGYHSEDNNSWSMAFYVD